MQVKETELISFGHIVASEQFAFGNYKVLEDNAMSIDEIVVQDEVGEINIVGQKFIATISKELGAITSYKVNGYELIKEPLMPNFWRAPTDNDFGHGMPKRCEVWKWAIDSAIIQDFNSKSVSKSEVVVDTKFQLPSLNGVVEITYLVQGDGQINVHYSFEAKKEDLPEIPRIGMVLKLPREFDNLNYYGRGPWENYIDRNKSSFIGLYHSKVAEQYFAYSRPQENGHKTGVRWLSLTNQSGLGIKILANNEPIEFNALHNSVADFDPGVEKLLRTTADIKEGNFVEVHIDHKMMGLGGDNSWGAKPHEPYMYYADRKYNFSFTLMPLR